MMGAVTAASIIPKGLEREESELASRRWSPLNHCEAILVGMTRTKAWLTAMMAVPTSATG